MERWLPAAATCLAFAAHADDSLVEDCKGWPELEGIFIGLDTD